MIFPILVLGCVEPIAFGLPEQMEPASASLNGSSETDWWPMFQHDPAHTGYSTSKVPVTNDTLWTSGISKTASVGAAPAVIDTRVVVTTSNIVYCFNSSSGLPLWEHSKVLDPSTSPAISEGRVFLGTGGEKILCLNLTNGDLIWNFTAEGWIRESSPVVAGTQLFVTSSWENNTYCLNVTNGALLWKSSLSYCGSASPTIAEDRVLIPSRDGKLYCLNTTTGSQIWNYTLNPSSLDQYASASYSNERVYIGVGTKNEVNKFVCLNYSSGELLWSYDIEGWILSAPAVANDKVAIGNRIFGSSAFLYCLNASTGSLVWRSETPEAAEYSSPIMADGKIVVSMGRNLYVFDESNGEIIWNYEPSGDWRSNGFFGACAAVAEGRIYIASQDGRLYCFGPMLYYEFSVDPTFYDNVGVEFAPLPSHLIIDFPNGTTDAVPCPSTLIGQMGTYTIRNVIWREVQVGIRSSTSIFLDSNFTWTPTIECVLPTRVSVSLSSSTTLLGFKVEIDGNLTCNKVGISAANVLLSYSVTGGGSWNDITQVETSSDGHFSAQWMPSATGNYVVRATWQGNYTFPASVNSVSLAVIPYESQYVFAVESNNTLSALAFNAASYRLEFTVSGENGTVGRTKVTIAKSLISTINQTELRVNGVEHDFTVIEMSDSWVLEFTYLHSSHTIELDLSLSWIPEFPSMIVALLFVSVILLSVMFLKRLSNQQRKLPLLP